MQEKVDKYKLISGKKDMIKSHVIYELVSKGDIETYEGAKYLKLHEAKFIQQFENYIKSKKSNI